ncbi:MAG: hypothetical protein H7062_00035 [Candidatus Saccharimonas sp.]|nr:hypothetical protein [Planctomycetaceae bacterium]
MKTCLQAVLYLLVATALSADEISPNKKITKPDSRDSVATSDDSVEAQPKLLRIYATVDGTGRIIVTGRTVCYERKRGGQLTQVKFDGEPWSDLDKTPPAWRDIGERLDLTRAWIVKRKGRDVIALETTPDGFDVYFCDSPGGAGDYEVTIAIPRRR